VQDHFHLVPIRLQRYRLIDRSQHRLQGMRDLVRSLLDMTRIESGRRERTLECLDLREIAQSAMEAFALDAHPHYDRHVHLLQ
jgi:signal transduction histidine kinase